VQDEKGVKLVIMLDHRQTPGEQRLEIWEGAKKRLRRG